MDSLFFREVNLESRIRPIYAVDMNSDYFGNIWISTSRGLYRVDGYKGHFYANNPNDSLSLMHNSVFSTYTDDQHQVWVCTDKGFQKYLADKDGFMQMASEYFEKEKENLYALSVYSICQLADVNYLVGSKMGLFLYNSETDEMVRNISLTDDRQLDNFSSNEHVYKIMPSTKNSYEFYLLTRSGICKYNISTEKVEWLANPDPLFFDDLSIRFYDLELNSKYIVVLDKKKFWYYHFETGAWNEFSEIPTNEENASSSSTPIIRDIKMLSDHTFLIATIENGMFEFDMSERILRPYSTFIGNDQEFNNLNKMTVDNAGYLWTLNALSTLIKSNVPIVDRLKEHPLHLVLDQIKINNRLISKFELPEKNNPILMENYQRQIFFEYALVNPSNKKDVKYSYRLEGFDKSWVETGTNRIANYSSLKPGKYAFNVRAEIDGRSVEETLVRLQLPTYFYETLLFKSLIGIAVLGIGFIVWSLQRKRKKEIQKFNVQLKDMELQALRAQMNPHFLFNTLNSIKNYVLTKGSDEAAEYLTKFSQLIRKILENSKQPLLSLEQEIEAMKLYVEMEHLRFNKDFTYSFDIDEDINTHRFKIAPMIVQPYIENAIWHGLMNKRGDKKLTVSFSSEEYGVLCIIEDNGIGRLASKEQYSGKQTNKKSLGLKITGDRIENINQLYNIDLNAKIIDKTIEVNGSTGTRVEIQLPYINEIKN